MCGELVFVYTAHTSMDDGGVMTMMMMLMLMILMIMMLMWRLIISMSCVIEQRFFVVVQTFQYDNQLTQIGHT